MERLQAVFVFVFVFVFVTPSFSSSDLFSVTDLKPLIMQGYGLRKAIVVNDTTVQVIIAARCTAAAIVPGDCPWLAYRPKDPTATATATRGGRPSFRPTTPPSPLCKPSPTFTMPS